MGSVSERLERCCFFQFMRSPKLGATHTEFSSGKCGGIKVALGSSFKTQ